MEVFSKITEVDPEWKVPEVKFRLMDEWGSVLQNLDDLVFNETVWKRIGGHGSEVDELSDVF
jgi:hypothetical protein